MIEEISEVLKKVDQEHAITIKEIAEALDEKEKKIAGVLQRMRKVGIVGFEKKEVTMIARINYTNKDLVAERTHKATPFFYWGRL